jgi:hypothetical protein
MGRALTNRSSSLAGSLRAGGAGRPAPRLSAAVHARADHVSHAPQGRADHGQPRAAHGRGAHHSPPLSATVYHPLRRGKTRDIVPRATDARTQVLQGIRLVKQYAWEAFYARQIGHLREKEVWTIRRVAMARACLIALVTFIPVGAAVLSFVSLLCLLPSRNPKLIVSSRSRIIIIFVRRSRTRSRATS